MNGTTKSPSTEPGNYTEPHLLVGVDADLLRNVREKARVAYMRAGGHRHAERMMRVMRLIDAELRTR